MAEVQNNKTYAGIPVTDTAETNKTTTGENLDNITPDKAVELIENSTGRATNGTTSVEDLKSGEDKIPDKNPGESFSDYLDRVFEFVMNKLFGNGSKKPKSEQSKSKKGNERLLTADNQK